MRDDEVEIAVSKVSDNSSPKILVSETKGAKELGEKERAGVKEGKETLKMKESRRKRPEKKRRRRERGERESAGGEGRKEALEEDQFGVLRAYKSRTKFSKVDGI